MFIDCKENLKQLTLTINLEFNESLFGKIQVVSDELKICHPMAWLNFSKLFSEYILMLLSKQEN